MNISMRSPWLLIPIVLIVGAVAVAGFIGFRSASPVDAQAIITDACADSRDVDSYQIVLTGEQYMDGTLRGRFRWDMKVNGDSILLVMENRDTVERTENYIVGDKLYSRVRNTQSEWSAWDVRSWDLPEPEPLGPVARVDDSPVQFCGTNLLEDHKFEGDVQLNGQSVKHFSAVSVDDAPGDADYEFWVDPAGQLQQVKVDELYEHGLEVKSVGTFTYPTQPFTITAPVIP